MAYNAGITRYQKRKWLQQLATLLTAGSLKCSLHSVTTTWDATTDPDTPQVYGVTGEVSSAGTGYTAGGYVLTAAVLVAAANAYRLEFADLVTDAGTIAAGTYCALIYDTTDSNRVLAICTVTITTGSSGGAMTITIPADALAIT